MGGRGEGMMGDGLKQILEKPIHLAEQVAIYADGTQLYRHECAELKSKAERLAGLLRQAARASELYEGPARRIVDNTEQVLGEVFSLVSKCRPHGLKKRVVIPLTAFEKVSTELNNSLANVSWLLRTSSAGADGDGGQLLGLPPIAQNEPILLLIWQHIATLHTGSLHARSDSAAALASLAGDSGRHGKLIIKEDGLGPLIRLVRDGQLEGQENAARALGVLGRDPEIVEAMIHAGVCSAFAKVLKDGPMGAQAMAAWAIAELAACHPKCQDSFAQNSVIRLLVDHLDFEAKNNNINAAAAADTSKQSQITHPMRNQRQANGNRMHSVNQPTLAARSKNHNGNHSMAQLVSQTINGRQSEDPATKAHMKAMAARALWQLAKGNPAICKSITESQALLCFAALLEKGPGKEVRHNSSMALMEIARVEEHHVDRQRSAFKPNSPAARAVIDQLLRVAEQADRDGDDDLLLPCVMALGCLSRTFFRATETRVIAPLVRLLDEREGAGAVSREAAIALIKFACPENHLHVDNSRAIIEAGGLEHLVQLVYFGKQVQIEALVLLCYIALHGPDGEKIAQAGVLTVLAWASRQGRLVQDPRVDSLLPEAMGRLEHYQSRGSTGFY